MTAWNTSNKITTICFVMIIRVFNINQMNDITNQTIQAYSLTAKIKDGICNLTKFGLQNSDRGTLTKPQLLGVMMRLLCKSRVEIVLE